MEKRKPNEAADGEAVANPDSTPEQPQRRIELPAVESPSISPVELGQATDFVAASPPEETEASSAGTVRENTSFSLVEFTAPKRPRFVFRPRHKRYALLAASVTIAAVIGAVTGAATTSGFSKAPPVDVAAVEENKAMQQSVARLTKEITSLKASLDTANRSASSQIAKISERLNRETANVTGSVPPQTQAAPPAPLPAARLEPAATAMQPRLSIVPDWTIRETSRRLRLCAGAWRHLSGRARGAAAWPRSGRTNQATGRTLAGCDAKRNYRVDARSTLFRTILNAHARPRQTGGAFGRRSSFAREPGSKRRKTVSDFRGIIVRTISCITHHRSLPQRLWLQPRR